MELGVASEQLDAVSAEGAVSNVGWMLRAALPRLRGGMSDPRWAKWPCIQLMLLLPDGSQNDYYFLMCSERMLNARQAKRKS
jgi:hypothetical protein